MLKAVELIEFLSDFYFVNPGDVEELGQAKRQIVVLQAVIIGIILGNHFAEDQLKEVIKKVGKN